MRFSKQREAVLAAVKGTKVHPDAEWVYGAVKREIPEISLGTVYRNLKELSAEGRLLALEVGDGCVHYDGDTSEHAHFFCGGCGKITDVYTRCEVGERLINQGYIIEKQNLTLSGFCPQCGGACKKT